VKLLLDQGASVRALDYAALKLAIINNHYETTAILRAAAGPRQGATPQTENKRSGGSPFN
jgi:hypothetical protein